jgi:hypothetical protein
MRFAAAALALLGACGGATATATATATTTTTATATIGAANVTATTSLTVDSLGAAPEDVDDHLHAVPVYVADLDKLYVEITSDGERAEVLRRSAATALGTLPFVVSVEDGGDLELHVELADLTVTPASDSAACKVKMFVMRLPQHDLLAIADGSGRATGSTAVDDCLFTTGTAVIQHKLPPFLQRQLDEK